MLQLYVKMKVFFFKPACEVSSSASEVSSPSQLVNCPAQLSLKSDQPSSACKVSCPGHAARIYADL